jgi:hypothetical protein
VDAGGDGSEGGEDTLEVGTSPSSDGVSQRKADDTCEKPTLGFLISNLHIDVLVALGVQLARARFLRVQVARANFEVRRAAELRPIKFGFVCGEDWEASRLRSRSNWEIYSYYNDRRRSDHSRL